VQRFQKLRSVGLTPTFDFGEPRQDLSPTVRGALSGMITKKLGQTVVSEKVPDRGRVYRITKQQA
jgi:hypothetical protein